MVPLCIFPQWLNVLTVQEEQKAELSEWKSSLYLSISYVGNVEHKKIHLVEIFQFYSILGIPSPLSICVFL